MSLSFGLFAITLLAVIVSQSVNADATLWDLIILANVEKSQLLVGESPIVFGKVVNHAEKSVSNSEITIRIGSTTIATKTDYDGTFRYELSEFQSIPGHYIAFISAKSPDGRIGYTSLELDIRGDIVISQTANIINTPEAQFYLNSNPENFSNDPIATKLYNYYQIQYEKLLKEENSIKKINAYQDFLNQQKVISQEFKQKEMELKKPGAGTYNGRNYNVFVDNLDPSVQEIMKNQLNHTRIMFQDAQNAMDEVLKQGGTMTEARNAYFEKAKISREQMEKLTKPHLSIINNNTETLIMDSQDNEVQLQESEQIIENYSVNGTATNLGDGSTMVSVNVNGTWIQFLVNGTHVTHLNNTSQK